MRRKKSVILKHYFFACKISRKNSQCAIILARSLIIRLTAVATLPHYESVQQGKQIQLKKNLTAAQRSVISLQFEGQIQ